MGYTEEIVNHLGRNGCEHEIIKNAENASVIMEKYKKLLRQGKAEGFTPLVIVPGDMLCEVIHIASTQYGDISEITSKVLDSVAFLNDRIKEATPIAEESDYDIVGDFADVEPTNIFMSLTDYTTKRPYETIIVAKIPTDKPWELAAWVPMGGWNECPAPEEQLTVFKYWHEKYSAFPAVVSGDIWEMYVENPPNTKDDAVALAWEQFGFCGDIIYQGAEKINVLASTLIDSKVWFFWWD